MTSLVDLYNFIFNYEVKTSFLATVRFITCGFIISYFLFIIRDVLFLTHPNKLYSGDKYINWCKFYTKISIFNLAPNSILFRNYMLIFFFVSGLSAALGLFTNFSILIFLIILHGIQMRMHPFLGTSGDPVAKTLLLGLLLTDCGSNYSIDNIFGIASNLNVVNGWGIRLIQFYLCFAWFCSTFFKLRDPNWATGASLMVIFSSAHWGRSAINFFTIPILMNRYVGKFMAISVLLFELFSFPLFYFSETRPFAIIFGLLLHLGISIFMTIGIFGPIMTIGVLYFCNQFFP